MLINGNLPEKATLEELIKFRDENPEHFDFAQELIEKKLRRSDPSVYKLLKLEIKN